jgi:magnesium transporter
LLLKDYILDKKILDMEDTEVEVVYDIKMVIKKNKLSVMDVDPPAYARLRRTGLNSVASIFHKGHDMSEDILIPWFYDTSVEALLRCHIAVLKKRAGGKPDVS